MELDRTLWDCEFSIAVFWGDHWHRVHRSVAMAAMGSNAIFAREDFELSYGPGRSFSAALRYRDYPMGQRGPEQLEEPRRTYRYTLEDERLTIDADHWDESLVCFRDCYNQEFVGFMDAKYRIRSSRAATAGKMRATRCGG